MFFFLPLALTKCLVFHLSQLSKAKAEARLTLLSNSVKGVELWLQNAMKQAEEELQRERHLSEQRKSTEEFSVSYSAHFLSFLQSNQGLFSSLELCICV